MARAGTAAVWSVAVALTACSGETNTPEQAPPPTEAPATVTGTVTLRPDDSIIGVGGFYTVGKRCDGAASMTGQDGRTRTYFGPPASTAIEGASVSVADDKGQTIGVGQLRSGQWVARPTRTNLSDHLCEIPFEVPLKRSSPFYAVQLGSQPVQRFAAGSPIAIVLSG